VSAAAKSSLKDWDMIYDLVIIGAGPSGLMAASTAAERGLKVLLVEKSNDISKITRACCQQFVMDENYEQENIRVENGRVLFPNNGFSIEYAGKTHTITDTYFISPQGHAAHFAYADKHPVAVKFDKGLLLQSLLEACCKKGVTFRNGTLACAEKDRGDFVEVHTTAQGKKELIRTRKLIAADGVNSRSTAALGMNSERTHVATALCIIYSLEGVENFEPAAMKWFMGRAYFSNAPVILDPSLAGTNVADLVIMGNKYEKPEKIFYDFTTKGPLAHQYKKARVIGKTGCAVKAYTSLPVPHRGNCLIIGDAAAYVEVEVQGGLMCGFHAGNAVFEELNGGEGFKAYTRWWQNTFEFNSAEALRVAQGYALVPTYEDDEIDYLFSLIEDTVLDGAYGQYRAPRLLWEAILEHKEKILEEKPSLFDKIDRNAQMTLEHTFKK